MLRVLMWEKYRKLGVGHFENVKKVIMQQTYPAR